MTRAERATEAARLRGEGLSGTVIAERLGISRSHAYQLLADPDGSALRARHEATRGTCVDCGGARSWGHPNGSRCRKCDDLNRTVWTEEAVVVAIRRFASRYGRPPTSSDFNPSRALKRGHVWRAERFYADGDYPFPQSVIERFGTWNAAIEAAGFAPQGKGKFPRAQGSRRGAHLAKERPAA